MRLNLNYLEVFRALKLRSENMKRGLFNPN